MYLVGRIQQATLTTEKITSYSIALNRNFLQEYFKIEPYKSFRDEEHSKFLDQIKQLTEKLDQIHKLAAAHEQTIQTQKELIETQRTLIENLNNLFTQFRR